MTKKKKIVILIIIILLVGGGLVGIYIKDKYWGDCLDEVNYQDDSSLSYMQNKINKANTIFAKAAECKHGERIHIMASFTKHMDLRTILNEMPEDSQVTALKTDFMWDGIKYSNAYKIEYGDVVNIEKYANFFVEDMPAEAIITPPTVEEFLANPTITAIQIIAPAGELYQWLTKYDSFLAAEMLGLRWRGVWRDLFLEE